LELGIFWLGERKGSGIDKAVLNGDVGDHKKPEFEAGAEKI
jgi:hypothetical protein